jgi:iron complex transport system substrate-binding protein
MRSARSLATLAAATVLATTVVACGDDDETSSTPVPTTDAIPTTSAPAPTTVPPTTATTTPTTNPEATTVPPTTAAPSTSAANDPDDPAAAAVAAWVAVFDSEEPFESKAPHLADAEALRPTIEAYRGAGSGFGGISLEPTDVVVEGATATITYDVNFGDNPAYGDQVGTITLVDDVWTVGRDEFCSFMSSARVPCA